MAISKGHCRQTEVQDQDQDGNTMRAMKDATTETRLIIIPPFEDSAVVERMRWKLIVKIVNLGREGIADLIRIK